MTRREVRDSAFKLVFEKLLRDDDIQELYDIAEDIDEIIVNDEVKELVDGTLAHADEIDEIISGYSKTRKLSRISRLDLAILRIAMYESLYDDRTPMNAAISEAVALAGVYTYKEDIAFINGVLGAFSRDRAELQEDNAEAPSEDGNA
ncbi:MAG: transcription antitermination factor NusB [Ruminococcus sp.]|nr:transcription antitermination factor NusB [Ruminococcus sp.]